MDFDLSDAQRQIRDLAREFAEREVRPRAAEIDRTDEFPWDLYFFGGVSEDPPDAPPRVAAAKPPLGRCPSTPSPRAHGL